MSKPFRLSAAAIVLSASVWFPTASAQAPKAQAHDTNIDGVTAEVIEAVRKEGVLSLKLRLRNSGAKPVGLALVNGGKVDTHYLVAGNTKMMVLKDSKNTALMPPLNPIGDLHPSVSAGGSYLFWAKFPAPPADAKKVSYYSPFMPPIEDIAITEAK
jgi:hypothetical protein